MTIEFAFEVTCRSGSAFGQELRFGVRGKGERNVVKIQEGGDGVEGRGSKDRRATEGEERVKRKVGRNTHSLSPLLFLFLGGSQIKARGKAKKKRRKNIGREGQQRTTRRFPPSNPPDDDRPRPSLHPLFRAHLSHSVSTPAAGLPKSCNHDS